jgi:hypothetical protein
MTFNELYRAILEVLPAAQLDEDQDGQIIVYTDLMIDPTSGTGSEERVIPYEDSDEEIPGEITRETYTRV